MADIIEQVVEMETKISKMSVGDAITACYNTNRDFMLDPRLHEAAMRGLLRAAGKITTPIASVEDRKAHRRICTEREAEIEAERSKVMREFGLSEYAPTAVMSGINALARIRLGRKVGGLGAIINRVYDAFPKGMTAEDLRYAAGQQHYCQGYDCPVHGKILKEDHAKVDEIKSNLKKLINELVAAKRLSSKAAGSTV